MKTVSPLELIGAQKARRAMASRLADAVAHVLGGIGVSLTVTIQDAEGDTKTGAVPFSTYSYCSWGAAFHAQAVEDQDKIAVAHIGESIVALQKQLAAIQQQIINRKDALSRDAQIEGEEPS
jgi:hypothetical protein